MTLSDEASMMELEVKNWTKEKAPLREERGLEILTAEARSTGSGQ